MTGADRVGSAIFSILTRAGIGPAHLLTTRGRKIGRPRTNPVILVQQGGQRWLVAPYGAVSWVLNARAAGRVALRRGRDIRDYTIRELPPAQSGPVLQRYIRIAPAARPYFQADKDSTAEDFIAEADRHRYSSSPPSARTPPDNPASRQAVRTGAEPRPLVVLGLSPLVSRLLRLDH
ncbi:MAG TPA: nitroreductase family deazaflavin-dependent oxidoreductase [Streptosporangiaceae bacterium]|nr:nitroreductase family deazaflavin-dependent oxidoreductase [Streptosporangiaceae bacterium]